MQDRININGVWYVKEQTNLNSDDIEVTNYQGCVWEDEECLFEATKLINNEGKLWGDVDIKFIDKALKKEEYFDNISWIRGVYVDELKSIEIAQKYLSTTGIVKFKNFISKLIKMKWL